MKRLIKKSFKNKVKDIQLLINIFKKQLVKESSVDLKKLTEAFNFLMDKNEKQHMLQLKNEIKKEDSDCIFNGTVYRKFNFYINELANNFLEEKDLDEPGVLISKKELLDSLRHTIKTGYVQSASETLDACQKFDPEEGGEIDIIISYRAEDGIAICRLLKKYYEIVNKAKEEIENEEYSADKYGIDAEEMKEIYESIMDLHSQFVVEEEVLAEIPDDYEIIEINNIKIDDLPEEFEPEIITGVGYDYDDDDDDDE